jgi:autotransporter-associated beta strand protein
VKITSGAIMDLAFSSELPKDIVGEMWLNGVQMYGTFNSDTQPDYFTGIGSLFAQGYGNYWAPAVGGGQGEAEDRWTATVEKWAMAPGIQGEYMQAATGALIFTDATGTVYVDGPVTASSGMTFEVDDYNLAAGDSIDGNAPVINLTGANAAANTITVATDATATIGVDLTSATGMTKAGDGTLVLSGANNTGTGQVRLQNGTVNVTGGTLTSAGQLRVGVAAGENAVLNLSGGAVVSFTTPGEWQYIGESALGTAEMTMSGSSSFSAGSLHIEGSGTVTVNDATITLDGGIGLWVARFGGAGTAVLNINDGAILNVNRFNMSANNSVGTSIVYQTGGEMNIVATLAGTRDGNIRIGTTNGMTATYNISGGTLYVDGRLATSGISPLQVGNGCTGTLNISGDGFVNMPYDSVTLGTAGTATGVINLDGGTLLTTYISKGAGSGTFNFNGGVLKSAAASETFMQGLTAANVKSGGARIDSNSYNITIGQALLHDAGLGGTVDGGLTKDGAGALTLSGVNTYTGDTTVSAGTLILADAEEVAGQLKFIITGTGETTNSNKITGAGTVQLDGEFIFDMDDAGVTLGDTWIIVDNATLAETFSSTFTLVDFTGGEGAGVLWSKPITSSKIYEFSEATGELKVKLAFAGDTNGDGVVDAVDYIALKTNFGVTEGATLEMGNFDAESDGNVDWDDLKILMANFGTRSGGGAPAATPEPATLGLLAIGALAVLRRRRRTA